MITIIDKLGRTNEVDFNINETLLTCIVRNNLDHGVGICGGCCDCATCHVRVTGTIDPVNEEEDATLDAYALNRYDDSKLGCQIRLTEQHDGSKFIIVNED
jgi:2Fe-2S ferredoxin